MSDKKVALVTGGGRGIGRAICKEMADAGYDLVVNYAGSREGALEVCEYAQSVGVQAIAVKADVSKAQQCRALIEEAKENFGRIDVLVNNAGITKDALSMRMTEEQFDRVIDVNLKGVFNMMGAVSKIMMKQRSGSIVNMASIVGQIGNVGQINYAAAKAGVIGMTKTLAKELAGRGVRVNAVAPGFIETDMTADLPEAAATKLKSAIPLGHLGQAEDVAKAVRFLAGDDSTYITGQVLRVDGGMVM